jgi:hypothetical protein
MKWKAGRTLILHFFLGRTQKRMKEWKNERMRNEKGTASGHECIT